MRETCGLRLRAGGGEGGHLSGVRGAAARICGVGLACFCAGLFALIGAPASTYAAAPTHFGESGSEEGDFNGPIGIGISAQTGDLFIPEFNNYRVSRFSEDGTFQLLWGWGVNEAAPADELQVCEAECQAGYGSLQGAFGAGAPFLAGGAAVDNEAASSSYGDVYVSEPGDFRVEKMTPDGKFLLMFGGEVNEGKDSTAGATEAEKDLCAAGEKCGRGVPGSANGQFCYCGFEHSFIGVGPGAKVYVGDEGRFQVFNEGGEWLESVSLATLGTAPVTALAVDGAGDVFVAMRGVPGVHELEPGPLGTWTEKAIVYDSSTTAISAIALDGSDHLYIADWSGGVSHILQYEVTTGQELESFGSNAAPALNGQPASDGLAFSDKLGKLYETSWWDDSVWVLTPPPPGPLIISESVTPELRGAATLSGEQNAEGNKTTYHFEYVTQAQYESGGFNGAASTASETIEGTFEDQRVEMKLPQKTLVPETSYEIRLVATNAAGTADGEPQLLEESPPARIDGPWVTNVSDTSATFGARINPLGAPTTYTIEYGATTTYGQTVSGEAGKGMEFYEVSFHLQNLEPFTTYHMRVVTHSEVGTVEGPDHVFTTQTARAEELALLDGRQWELVSPPDKHGARIEPNIVGGKLIQASANGSSIFYPTSEPVGEGGQGKGVVTPNISTRTPEGWKTLDLTLPFQIPPEESETTELAVGATYSREYKALSADLSLAAIDPDGEAPPLSEEATQRTIYLRDIPQNVFTPMVTCAKLEVTPCPNFGGAAGLGLGGIETRVGFEGGTPDFAHIILKSHAALTKDASTGENAENLYEWGEGKLKLVSVLPGGKAAEAGVLGSRGDPTFSGTELGPSAISSDGRWVVWGEGNYEKYVYLRDMVAGKTVRLGGARDLFEAMSTDGSRIFYVKEGPRDPAKGEEQNELYVYEPATETTTDLTAGHGAEERSAGVQDPLLGESEDGSYLYFVATGVLAAGAHHGEDNLYSLHHEGGKWTTTYIAALAPWKQVPGCYSGCEFIGDSRDWRSQAQGAVPHTYYGNANVAHVSPNGQYLTFMSKRSLTGYDNRDALSGEPDQEVYLYDAATGKLVCASCNPTGSRPLGLHDANYEVESGEKHYLRAPLIDFNSIWSGQEGPNGEEVGTWIAADLPGWLSDEGPFSHKPRSVDNNGRLFFNSTDALVPQDTNGRADVYEYEPSGVGSCKPEVVVYSERAGGCIDLISSGSSTFEADYYDSSATGPGGEEGEDVFFISNEKLVPSDYDVTTDVYDAHQCSAAVPCPIYPTIPPPCTSGDSCKAAPSPQPTLFGPPASATFKGTGNAIQGPAPKHLVKQLTRAQKLKRAMRACRRKKRRKRAACMREAKRRYGAKGQRGTGASKRGRR